MARDYSRSRRVEEQIQRILAEVVRTELRDPAVSGVVITEVRAARDLGTASVFYTLLSAGTDEPDPAAREAVQAGLQRASGFLRTRVARELDTRTVPELRFRYDEAGERSRSLDRLIDEAVNRDRDGSPQ